MYACLPQNCVFRNKNYQNLEHSTIFINTLANISPNLWNNSNCQIIWENHRAVLHCEPPLPIPRSPECCFPITLNCLPVQSFHNSTANFKVDASVTFLVYGDERPLLMVSFLKHLKTSPFCWRWSCRYTTAILSLTHKMFSKMVPWFWKCLQLAAFWMQWFLRNTSEKFLLHVFHTHAEHYLHVSVFHECLTHLKAALISSSTKSFSYPWEKSVGTTQVKTDVKPDHRTTRRHQQL